MASENYGSSAAALSISGHVLDQSTNEISNLSVFPSETVCDLVLSGPDGSYSFPGLPADGSYLLNSLDGVDLFTPPEQDVSLLFDKESGLDFTLLAPTVVDVSVSGRVVGLIGRGVSRAIVSLTDGTGRTKNCSTNTFCYLLVGGIRAGNGCVLNVASRRMTFPPLFLSFD